MKRTDGYLSVGILCFNLFGAFGAIVCFCPFGGIEPLTKSVGEEINMGNVERRVSFALHATLQQMQTEHGVLLGEAGLSNEAATYADYRRFVSRRLACLRQQLKLVNSTCKSSHRSYVRKEADALRIDEDVLVSALPAERAWARSQELKLSRNLDEAEDPRVKARLRKAVVWARRLVTLCDVWADERTKREARSWSHWLCGLAAEKNGDLARAVAELREAHEEYGSLGFRCVDVLGSLKRCEYALTGRVTHGVDDEDQEHHKEGTAIEWCGRRLRDVPVNLVLKMHQASGDDEKGLAELDETLREVDKADNFVDKELFVSKLKFKKLQLVSDRVSGAIKRHEQSWKQHALRQTAELVSSIEQEPAGAEPLVHLYDNLSQLAQDMAALPGVAENDSLVETLEARIATYRAQKCYYLAETFFDRRLFGKARKLFEYTDALAERATLEAEASGESAEPLTALSDAARGGQIRCKIAKHVLARPTESLRPVGVCAQVLAHIPPKPKQLSCKPFVFDIAHDALRFPLDGIQTKAGRALNDAIPAAGIFGWFRRRRHAN